MLALSVDEILSKCRSVLNSDTGFEIYPFKVGWYNDKVVKQFKLDYHYDTLSVLVISQPCMFEKTFLPWLFANRQRLPEVKDFIDECMQWFFNQVKQLFSDDIKIEIIHDFDMVPAFRRPKMLMTTAGHVSGAAYYYQMPETVETEQNLQANLPSNSKFLGLSVHPSYGGWFAFRACFIFENVQIPHLERKEPEKLLIDDQQIIDLLKLFNYHWQDYRYRDAVPVPILDRYSERQRQYFSTKPSERRNLVEKWLQTI